MKDLPNCVMLDLDGTLLDSIKGLEYSVRECLEAEAIETDLAQLPALIGPPIRIILGHLLPEKDAAVLDRLTAGFRVSYDTRGYRKTTLFPDAAQVLRALAQSGRRLFVVSNKPEHIARPILQETGIAELFEAVVTRDSRLPHFENKTQMIRHVLDHHGFDPKDAVMVGDTMEDGRAASETGVGFIFMTHGYGELEDGIDAVRCTGFSEWLPWLAGKEQH